MERVTADERVRMSSSEVSEKLGRRPGFGFTYSRHVPNSATRHFSSFSRQVSSVNPRTGELVLDLARCFFDWSKYTNRLVPLGNPSHVVLVWAGCCVGGVLSRVPPACWAPGMPTALDHVQYVFALLAEWKASDWSVQSRRFVCIHRTKLVGFGACMCCFRFSINVQHLSLPGAATVDGRS